MNGLLLKPHRNRYMKMIMIIFFILMTKLFWIQRNQWKLLLNEYEAITMNLQSNNIGKYWYSRTRMAIKRLKNNFRTTIPSNSTIITPPWQTRKTISQNLNFRSTRMYGQLFNTDIILLLLSTDPNKYSSYADPLLAKVVNRRSFIESPPTTDFFQPETAWPLTGRRTRAGRRSSGVNIAGAPITPSAPGCQLGRRALWAVSWGGERSGLSAGSGRSGLSAGAVRTLRTVSWGGQPPNWQGSRLAGGPGPARSRRSGFVPVRAAPRGPARLL